MIISDNGGHDDMRTEFLIPLYPGDPWHEADAWTTEGLALLAAFEAATLDHMPKVVTSARRLLAAGRSIRPTIGGLACTPPEDFDHEAEGVGDWLEGEEWPWAGYFRRLGLPVHPVDMVGGAPRGIPEVVEAEGEAMDRVWYSRSVDGMIHARDVNPMNAAQPVPPPDTVSGVLRSQMEMEEQYGRESLEEAVDDPFAAGMIAGKLSCLRWLMGDEWDMLDT